MGLIREYECDQCGKREAAQEGGITVFETETDLPLNWLKVKNTLSTGNREVVTVEGVVCSYACASDELGAVEAAR